MKISVKNASLALFMAASLLSPLPGLAQNSVGSDDPSKVDAQANKPEASSFQLVTCTGVKDPRTGKGVECDYNQLVQTAYRVVKFILYLLIPILLGVIFVTGWKFLTAGGDAMKLESAKKMLKPLFIGLFLIFGAWLLVYTVLDKLLAPAIGGIQKSSIVPSGANK